VAEVALASGMGEGVLEERPRREGQQQLEVALAGLVEPGEEAVDEAERARGTEPKRRAIP
jgi:hypothetical protein